MKRGAPAAPRFAPPPWDTAEREENQEGAKRMALLLRWFAQPMCGPLLVLLLAVPASQMISLRVQSGGAYVSLLSAQAM